MSAKTRKMMKKNNGKKIPKEFKQKRGPNTILYNTIPSMPPEFDTVIKTFGTILSSAATASVFSEVATNSLLHTADALSGSGSSPLANIARNYSKYRVVGYSIKYNLLSRSTVDVNVAVLHTPNSVSANYPAGSSWNAAAPTSDKSFYYLVPASTKAPCLTGGSQKYQILSVLGQEEFEEDNTYYGTINTSGVPTAPTDQTFVAFYSGQASGGTFTANTTPHISVTLKQYVRFYDRYN